jgi:leucine dehydrogenase
MENKLTVFEGMTAMGHEEVAFCHDAETGLKAIIAIHSTVLGPALGGTRMWAYQDEAEAVRDVLRLSRGMTFKASVAGLNLGGGKAVIIGDATKEKTDALKVCEHIWREIHYRRRCGHDHPRYGGSKIGH